MSALLGSQESSGSSSSSFSSQVIDAADTNGDGTVSLEELAASLSADSSSLTEAFNAVDTDGDGQITSTELDAGFKAKGPPHGPPPGPPPGQSASASDTASTLLSAGDTDDSGSLSLSEINTILGKDSDDTSLTSAFSSLDTNGDGSLASDELTAGIKALFEKQLAAYAANASNDSATSTTSVSLAA